MNNICSRDDNDKADPFYRTQETRVKVYLAEHAAAAAAAASIQVSKIFSLILFQTRTSSSAWRSLTQESEQTGGCETLNLFFSQYVRPYL